MERNGKAHRPRKHEIDEFRQAVKRNLDRFPEEFAFTLGRDEILRIS